MRVRRECRGAATLAASLAALLAAAVAAGCGTSSASGSAGGSGGRTVLRLGYFPNVTHATALAGVSKGIFAKALGGTAALKTSTFNAGPAAVEALFSDAVEAVYIGPNPTINAYAKSHGSAIRVLSGATSGGAALVVKPAITSPADLKGKRLATPQLGNTQDVALRYWLRQHGLRTDPQGGGDVSVRPQENSVTLDAFSSGAIDGAWVPEPYASRLVAAGGRVLVDERSLWPGGRFVTTQLVVRTDYLRAHRDVFQRLLAGQVDATTWVNENPAAAQQVVNRAIGKITGKQLKPAVLAAAWKNLTFTDDPIASSLRTAARHAHDVGLLPSVPKLDGLYDLTLLDTVLRARHQPAVSAA